MMHDVMRAIEHGALWLLTARCVSSVSSRYSSTFFGDKSLGVDARHSFKEIAFDMAKKAVTIARSTTPLGGRTEKDVAGVADVFKY